MSDFDRFWMDGKVLIWTFQRCFRNLNASNIRKLMGERIICFIIIILYNVSNSSNIDMISHLYGVLHSKVWPKYLNMTAVDAVYTIGMDIWYINDIMTSGVRVLDLLLLLLLSLSADIFVCMLKYDSYGWGSATASTRGIYHSCRM